MPAASRSSMPRTASGRSSRSTRPRMRFGVPGIGLARAGHKGYAIAVVVDMLAGVLSGSSFVSAVNGPYKTHMKSGAGHFILAIDIAKLQPLEEFNARMQRFVDELKSTPR